MSESLIVMSNPAPVSLVKHPAQGFLLDASAFAVPCKNATGPAAALWREEVLAVLGRALDDERGWVRVHAAEALIAVGEGARAREVYAGELPALEASSTRVGAWRVLAATARTPAERAALVRKIEQAFLADSSPDRLQALESLCKLKETVAEATQARARAMGDGPEMEQPLACWALHLGGDSGAAGRLGVLLSSEDAAVRLRTAYALRWLRSTDRAILARIAAAADAEPIESAAYPFLIGAALALDANPARVAVWLKVADEILVSGPAGARYEICQALVQRGRPVELVRLAPLLRHAGDDVRIGIAWLMLETTRKHRRGHLTIRPC